MKTVTRETKRAIVAEFKMDPKTPLAELARTHGVHRMTVRSVLEAEGLWTKPEGFGRIPNAERGKTEEDRIVEDYKAGQWIPDIAARRRKHPSEVRDLLIKRGVRLRTA